MFMVTWPRWSPHPYKVKFIVNLLLWNQKANYIQFGTCNLTYFGMQHGDVPYQVFTNDTTRSNLIPNTFMLEKSSKVYFSITVKTEIIILARNA